MKLKTYTHGFVVQTKTYFNLVLFVVPSTSLSLSANNNILYIFLFLCTSSLYLSVYLSIRLTISLSHSILTTLFDLATILFTNFLPKQNYTFRT